MTMAIKSNKKYSVTLHREGTIHKTSISLEPIFWDTLCLIVSDRRSTVSGVVQSIDERRRDKTISSEIRCYCIEYIMDSETRLKLETIRNAERTGTNQARYGEIGA